MKRISLILCSMFLTNVVANAQIYKRTLPKMPEPVKEITKDTKTGFMLGVETGFNLIKGDNSDRFVVDSGLKIGYSLFFTKTWGMRLYGSYSYSFDDFVTSYKGVEILSDLYANTHTFLFNADALYDFYNNSDLKLSLGVILGVGAGYQISPQKTYPAQTETYNYTQSGFKVACSAGFSLAFASKHRLEILYRYVVLQPDMQNIVKNNNGTSVIRTETFSLQSPFSFHLGYSFVF